MQQRHSSTTQHLKTVCINSLETKIQKVTKIGIKTKVIQIEVDNSLILETPLHLVLHPWAQLPQSPRLYHPSYLQNTKN